MVIDQLILKDFTTHTATVYLVQDSGNTFIEHIHPFVVKVRLDLICSRILHCSSRSNNVFSE